MKKRIKIGILILCIFLLLLLPYMLIRFKNTHKTIQYEKPKIYIDPMFSARFLNFEFCVKYSELIIVGKVIKKEQVEETITAQPGTNEYGVAKAAGIPFVKTLPRLYVTAEVEKVLKGKLDEKQIDVGFVVFDPKNHSDLFAMNPGEKFVFVLTKGKNTRPNTWYVNCPNRFVFKVNSNNTVYPACWWYDEKYKKKYFNITLDQLSEEFKRIDKLENVPMYDDIPKEVLEKYYEAESESQIKSSLEK
ncbi:hypothetical protein [Caldicellulosiruptor danielii]|uniref:SAF domain-containing protein n=2 Tax=Anaerocellum danielii TaxID=1387557 RepID=A0ABZ0U5E4_9FIRM|nr:hypothetical protein [Caldicellulosiruptor danielii]WPX09689.1 hypothetical protein SOJ16_000925 [Caldicellulosiruptor danielii]